MSRATSLREAVRAFHADESGMETLQVVMIVAVAAICLILIRTFWGTIKSWARSLMSSVTGWRS